MKRVEGFIVLVVGVVLLVWGFTASQSTASDVSRFFTGAATDKSIWLIIGGAMAAIAGASIAFTGRGKRA